MDQIIEALATALATALTVVIGYGAAYLRARLTHEHARAVTDALERAATQAVEATEQRFRGKLESGAKLDEAYDAARRELERQGVHFREVGEAALKDAIEAAVRRLT